MSVNGCGLKEIITTSEFWAIKSNEPCIGKMKRTRFKKKRSDFCLFFFRFCQRLGFCVFVCLFYFFLTASSCLFFFAVAAVVDAGWGRAKVRMRSIRRREMTKKNILLFLLLLLWWLWWLMLLLLLLKERINFEGGQGRKNLHI